MSSKKLFRLFAIVFALLVAVCAFVACDSETNPDPAPPQPQEKSAVVLDAPNLTVGEDGVVTWSAVQFANGYLCQSSDGKETRLASTERNCTLKSGETVRVRALGDGEDYLDSPFSFACYYSETKTETVTEPVSATKLAKPVLSVSEDGLVTWESVENAKGYKYRVSTNPQREVPLSADSRSLKLGKSLTLFLKATGDGVTYFDSDYAVLVYTKDQSSSSEDDDGRQDTKTVALAFIDFVYDSDKEQRDAFSRVVAGNASVDDVVAVFGKDGLMCDFIDTMTVEVGSVTMMRFFVQVANVMTSNQYEEELALLLDLHENLICKIYTDEEIADFYKAFFTPIDADFVKGVADFGKKVNDGEEVPENFTFIFVDYLLEVIGDDYTPTALKKDLHDKIDKMDTETKVGLLFYLSSMAGEGDGDESDGTLMGMTYDEVCELLSGASDNPIVAMYVKIIDEAVKESIDLVIDETYTPIYNKLVEISKLDRIPVASEENGYDYTTTEEYAALDKALKELATLVGLGETVVDPQTGEETFVPDDLMGVFGTMGTIVAFYVAG